MWALGWREQTEVITEGCKVCAAYLLVVRIAEKRWKYAFNHSYPNNNNNNNDNL